MCQKNKEHMLPSSGKINNISKKKKSMQDNERQGNIALFILTESSADLGPFFKKCVSIGQQ